MGHLKTTKITVKCKAYNFFNFSAVSPVHSTQMRTLVRCAKTAEPVGIPFVGQIHMDPYEVEILQGKEHFPLLRTSRQLLAFVCHERYTLFAYPVKISTYPRTFYGEVFIF